MTEMHRRTTDGCPDCLAHSGHDKAIIDLEKDVDDIWTTVNAIRAALQKQAIQIAIIVGGVTTVVQLLAFAVEYLKKP